MCCRCSSRVRKSVKRFDPAMWMKNETKCNSHSDDKVVTSKKKKTVKFSRVDRSHFVQKRRPCECLRYLDDDELKYEQEKDLSAGVCPGPDADGYYLAENIIKRRQKADGSFEFLVRWKGWGPQHDSWVPYSHCNSNLQEIIRRRYKLKIGNQSTQVKPISRMTFESSRSNDTRHTQVTPSVKSSHEDDDQDDPSYVSSVYLSEQSFISNAFTEIDLQFYVFFNHESRESLNRKDFDDSYDVVCDTVGSITISPVTREDYVVNALFNNSHILFDDDSFEHQQMDFFEESSFDKNTSVGATASTPVSWEDIVVDELFKKVQVPFDDDSVEVLQKDAFDVSFENIHDTTGTTSTTPISWEKNVIDVLFDKIIDPFDNESLVHFKNDIIEETHVDKANTDGVTTSASVSWEENIIDKLFERVYVPEGEESYKSFGSQ